MKNINEYFDEIKEKYELKSDNQLAIKLGISRSAVSQVRRGGSVSNDTAFKMAEMLEIPEEEIILIATAERCHIPRDTKVWRNILARFETSEEIGNWRARHDSNVRPTGSKPVTLSS